MIIFLLTLLVVCQVVLVGGMLLIWQKVNLYLTWNTRNDSLEYEQAITKPKFRKPPAPASKTENRGREIKSVDDLVDISDLDFDTGLKMVEDIADGS